jgi:hypothetical protein
LVHTQYVLAGLGLTHKHTQYVLTGLELKSYLYGCYEVTQLKLKQMTTDTIKSKTTYKTIL